MGKITFNLKNKVSCKGVSMWSVLWEYICWVLAGKPDNHTREILDENNKR